MIAGGMLGRGVMNRTRASGVVASQRERRSPWSQVATRARSEVARTFDAASGLTPAPMSITPLLGDRNNYRYPIVDAAFLTSLGVQHMTESSVGKCFGDNQQRPKDNL